MTPEERERRWRDLAACYYAQQLSHYPRDYILREKNLPERVVETVERFEEDFTDHMRDARAVSRGNPGRRGNPCRHAARCANELGDPVMAEVRRQLQTMINELAAERTPV